MSSALIQQLLQGTWKDPDTGQPIKLPIAAIVIEKGIKQHIKELVSPLDIGETIAVVSDSNTYAALGNEVEKSLAGIKNVISVQLPGTPVPDDKTVALLRQETRSADALVAVGSGTINDLCKYTSFLDRKPYIIFGTAPSMNGYASANAAITINGHKKSLAAHLPVAICLDLDVLSTAPIRLIRSGVGDSLCRSTAQADWLLSHLLRGTFYTNAPFSLLKEDEEWLLEESGGLVNGDVGLMAHLANTLILSGVGMYLSGGSYPASQGEHLIAHTIEMVYGKDMPMTYHGEQIGVTTLTMARLQEKILQNRPVVMPDIVNSKMIKEFLGAKIAKQCISEFKKKMITQEEADRINARLDKEWESIFQIVEAIKVPYGVIAKVLKNIGAPMNPIEIGWQEEKYRKACYYARYIRDRFTFLDVANGMNHEVW